MTTVHEAAMALCEAVERFFGRCQPETHPLCGCIVCQARALRAALAPERDRLADFLDDKAGACAGAELAAENTEQAFVAQVEETMFRAAAAALRATPSEDWGRAEVTDRLTRARDTALLTTMRYLGGTPDEQGVTPTEYTFQAARSELERALAAVAAFREATGTKEENDVPMR